MPKLGNNESWFCTLSLTPKPSILSNTRGRGEVGGTEQQQGTLFLLKALPKGVKGQMYMETDGN